jgi:N-acetylglutamate synthase-like GNAT family acetyltransferase
MLKIRKLKTKDEKNLRKILKQLTGGKIKLDVKSLIRDKNIHCAVLEYENNVIGFGSLIVHQVPSKGKVARVEDVVILETERGKGYGRKIMEELIKIARKKKVKNINLTSSPKRVEARKLYKSLGFETVETDLFRLEL